MGGFTRGWRLLHKAPRTPHVRARDAEIRPATPFSLWQKRPEGDAALKPTPTLRYIYLVFARKYEAAHLPLRTEERAALAGAINHSSSAARTTHPGFPGP